MSATNETKINRLLQSQPEGTLYLASWMVQQGYSRELQKKYRESGWLEPIGVGAMKRKGEAVDWLGALYSLQTQGGLSLHAGGRTALSLQGLAHFIEEGKEPVYLYTPYKETPPKWLTEYDWGMELRIIKTNFLPQDVGLVPYQVKGFDIRISAPPRALMEYLYHVPADFDMMEAYHLMENLNNLHPSRVRELLEKSRSVKVNRLFLYLAQKAGHAWYKHIDITSVKLGKGKRSLAKKGVLVKEWQITVPKELEAL
jgi:hypothetical protein